MLGARFPTKVLRWGSKHRDTKAVVRRWNERTAGDEDRFCSTVFCFMRNGFRGSCGDTHAAGPALEILDSVEDMEGFVIGVALDWNVTGFLNETDKIFTAGVNLNAGGFKNLVFE